MTSHNADVVLNTHSTHRTTSFIRTQGGDNITSFFPRHQTSTHDSVHTHSVRATQAVPEKIFQTGGGYIDFTLPRLTKKVDELTLSMTVKNSSTTASAHSLARRL